MKKNPWNGRVQKPVKKPARKLRRPEALRERSAAPEAEPEGPARVQKALAAAGRGSRREIEGWIRDGRVRVNGNLAELGERVGPGDKVQVDGRLVNLEKATREPTRVILYHKPIGELVTRRDPEGRPTVFANLPKIFNGRWVAVGRLDINTAGLILFTNHGELAERLMRPAYGVEREYAVRVLGRVTDENLERLRKGVELDDGPARFEAIREAGGDGANHWYHAILKEGRHREVRRLWEVLGITVSRLLRVRYGPVRLDRRVRPGHWEELNPRAVAELAEGVDYKPTPPPGPRRSNFRSHKKNPWRPRH